jgi:hypothetical protein
MEDKMMGIIYSPLPFVRRFDRTMLNAFFDDHPEVRASPDVRCQYDWRQHDYVHTLQSSAIHALLNWIVISSTCFTKPEHVAAEVQWRAEHQASMPRPTPAPSPRAFSVLPGQMTLFGED